MELSYTFVKYEKGFIQVRTDPVRYELACL